MRKMKLRDSPKFVVAIMPEHRTEPESKFLGGDQILASERCQVVTFDLQHNPKGLALRAHPLGTGVDSLGRQTKTCSRIYCIQRN